jgi:thioredoxin 1
MYKKRFLKMKKTIVLTTLTLLFSFGATSNVSAQKNSSTNFFKGSYDEVLREAKKQNKSVLLDFYAAWCSPCQRLDRETFANKDFAQYANQNILVYKVDIESFDGMEIAEKFGVDVFPSMLLMDAKKRKIASYKGFYEANFLQKEIAKYSNRNGSNYSYTNEGVIVKK